VSAVVVYHRRQQVEVVVAPKTMRVLVSQVEFPGSIPDWSDYRWKENLLQV
jgi:hypothetical protein